MSIPSSGGTGTVRAAARRGGRPAAKSSAPVPVPPSLADPQALADLLALPHLEMAALPSAVPWARRYARQLLWDVGLKELVELAELVVSEIVTNAVRVSAGLTAREQARDGACPVVRLWLNAGEDSVVVLVWDASPLLPKQQAPPPDAESGRGLLLVETLSAAWGSCPLPHQHGKVVWALCTTPD